MAPPPDEHRSSFVRFLMASAATGGNTKRGAGGMTTAWERLAHSATLLGYGQLVSFVTVVFVAWVSSLEWTEESEDGVPKLNHWTVLNGIWLPHLVLYAAATCFNIYQCSAHPKCGPRFARVPIFVGLGLVPTFYGIQAAVLSTETDSTYYGLDLAIMAAFGVAFVVLDVTIRRIPVVDQTSTQQHHESAELNFAPESTFATADDTGQPEQQTAPSNNKMTLFQKWVFTLLPYLAACCIGFAYPFSIIPLFFSSSVPTRIAICLFLHPVLLEVAEAFSRSQSADVAANHLRDGTITLDIAERQITQISVMSFTLKQLMAFFRRFMLLNMGSPDATLIALVVTAIEEAASRGLLVQIDTTIRSLRGLPELKGDDLRLQRLVWMCDSNQSCIAEFNAILTSTFAHVLLQRYAVIFAIGYETNRGVSTSVVFVQLLVELTLELLVDNTSMRVVQTWAESEHGIPVTRYFVHANGNAVFGHHALVSIVALCNALFSFIRHPHFSSCGSNDVCDCLDQAMFREWVGDACAMGNVSFTSEMRHVSESLNSTTAEPTLDLLDDVDFFAVILALFSGVAALALIVLAVLFARYRKRQQTVVALVKSMKVAEQARLDAEAENKELKESLARTSVRSRLRARPPTPFTLDEFLVAVDEDGERELNGLVVALCSDWIFNSPIDDAKWAYFRTYVVQLPLWREPSRFRELQGIARDASKVVKKQVVRLLESMSGPDSVHGTWLVDELDHINSDRNIASLASWVDPKLICASDVLSTPAAKQEFEVEVMPTAVRALSNMLFEPFKTQLGALSPRVLEEEEDDGPNHGRTAQRRFSTLELLDSEETEGSFLLRCSREKSVKGAKRMGAKVEEAHANGVPFPAINNIGDALRASLSAATSEGVRECWSLVERNFEFKTAIAELRSGGELHTVSPNLHANCLFRHDVDGKEIRIVVELQIYALPILETKREAHKIYDVTRAHSIDALLSEYVE